MLKISIYANFLRVYSIFRFFPFCDMDWISFCYLDFMIFWLDFFCFFFVFNNELVVGGGPPFLYGGTNKTRLLCLYDLRKNGMASNIHRVLTESLLAPWVGVWEKKIRARVLRGGRPQSDITIWPPQWYRSNINFIIYLILLLPFY